MTHAGKEPQVRTIVRALHGAPPATMATLRFLLKRFVAQRSLGLAVVVTLAFTIGVLVAGPIYADAACEAILSSSLGGESVTVTNARLQLFAGPDLDWNAADDASTGAFGAIPVDTQVPQGLGTARLGGADGPSVPLVFREGAPEHLAIEGDPPGAGEIRTAREHGASLGLGAGDSVALVGPNDESLDLRISGTFDSPDREDAFYGDRSPFPAPDSTDPPPALVDRATYLDAADALGRRERGAAAARERHTPRRGPGTRERLAQAPRPDRPRRQPHVRALRRPAATRGSPAR